MRPIKSFTFLLFLLSVFHSQNSFARNPAWQLEVDGTVMTYDASLLKNVPTSLCTVFLYKDSVQIKEIPHPAHGQYTFMLDPDHDYIISAEYEGFIKQKIIVSTKEVPDNSWHNFKILSLDLVLFKTFPEYNYSFTEKPLVRFCYNYEADDFDYDAVYELEMRQNAIKMEALSDIAMKHQLYDNEINKGDEFFKAMKWDDAKAAYQGASANLPFEQYPKDQIKICDEKLDAIKKEQEAKDAKYASLLSKADSLFAKRNYAQAKSTYQQASLIHPELHYPVERIKDCDNGPAISKQYDDLIKNGDTQFKLKDYVNAKATYENALNLIPGEQYPKDQITICDQALKGPVESHKFQDLISDADAKFVAKDYAGAKTKYQEASNYKPTEQYPKDQIKLCDAKIKAQGDGPAVSSLEKQYADLIAQADKLFSSSDFKNAKAKYQEATSLKPNEQYPKDQVKICDNKLTETPIDKAYKDTIQLADKLYALQDYSNAKIKYQHASTIKPAEEYPKDRINLCDENIASKRENDYNAAIAIGDAKMKAKDWTAAKAKYQEASALKPAEQYPKDQIGICNQAIANGW
jgi:hypothetical protein